MNWKLDKNRPICPQICEQMCTLIATGKLLPRQRLMSVREVALAAGVNPNTVQHAFEQLEQQGILFSVRGAGWFVAEDTTAAAQMRQRLVDETLKAFFSEMSALGISPEDTKTFVKEWQP